MADRQNRVEQQDLKRNTYN